MRRGPPTRTRKTECWPAWWPATGPAWQPLRPAATPSSPACSAAGCCGRSTTFAPGCPWGTVDDATPEDPVPWPEDATALHAHARGGPLFVRTHGGGRRAYRVATPGDAALPGPVRSGH